MFRFYTFIWGVCLVFFVFVLMNQMGQTLPCVFKSATGYACAGCGISRAISLAFSGEFLASLQTNPLGIFLLLIAVFCFSLLISDTFTSQKNLYKVYLWFNRKLKNFWVIFFFVLLFVVNWAWNIIKGI